MKRLFDIVSASVVLVCTAVFMLGAALVIFLEDGKNPFFIQKRVGRGGKPFNLLKLRSMRADADIYLKAYLAKNKEAAAEWAAYQKLENDPRITKIGRFIRKSSLDELPQLINIILGDMSVVGPRPMLVEQLDIYECPETLALRPGLTGLWQVKYRNDSTFSERAHVDLEYMKSMSFVGDLALIFQTVGVVANATGK